MPDPAQPPTDERSPDGAAAAAQPAAAEQEFLRGLGETVNHHVRTALTPLLGHTELLLAHEQQLPAEVHRSLHAVARAGRRLSDVVLGICELIGIACADGDADEPIDVSALLADEDAAHRIRASRKGVLLEVGGDRVRAHGVDPTRLWRALEALLDNAVRHAPAGSTVRVTTTTAIGRVRITVSDEGRGIDPADSERLVLPFERGCHPPGAVAGRGMGLALASAFATSNGGRLVLSESASGGLEVALDLPAVNGQRSAGALAPQLLHRAEDGADGGHPLGAVPVAERDGPA
ncbi:signal transduction histidine kinase [Agrococcus sp. UYP10]|uniref:sensor histidine kinase n=1 Tax=Agrococcus sp. UYP10 TaxID=1756355 RepID=UPI00339935A2